MPSKSKIIFSVTAIFLIPILLGITPLNFVQKIGAGCPFSQGKQALTCNPCPFNSILSQEDHGIANLPLTLFEGDSVDLGAFEILNSRSITSNCLFRVIRLRC